MPARSPSTAPATPRISSRPTCSTPSFAISRPSCRQSAIPKPPPRMPGDTAMTRSRTLTALRLGAAVAALAAIPAPLYAQTEEPPAGASEEDAAAAANEALDDAATAVPQEDADIV